MRSNPNLIEAPSPVIGYFKLDGEEGNGTGGVENHATTVAPAIFGLILSLVSIIVLN